MYFKKPEYLLPEQCAYIYLYIMLQIQYINQPQQYK